MVAEPREWIDLLLGLSITLFFGYERFKLPPDASELTPESTTTIALVRASTRATTTALRFYSVLALYLSGMACVYFVFALHGPIWEVLNNTNPTSLKGIGGLSAPLIAALLLSLFLPQTPFLNRWERELRRRAQRVARIPREVLRVAQELAEINIRSEAVRPDPGDGSSSLIVDLPTTEQLSVRSLRRAEQLSEILGRWPKDPDFSDFVQDNRVEFDEIMRVYGVLSEGTLFSLRALVKAKASSAELNHVARSAENQCEAYLQFAHEFISRAVLQNALTEKGRAALFRQIGFDRSPEPPPYPFRTGMLVFFAGALILGVGFWMGGMLGLSRYGAFTGLLKAMQIALYFVIPTWVAAGIVGTAPVSEQKSRWRSVDLKVGWPLSRPWPAYFAVGLIAAACTALVSMVFRFVELSHDVPGYWHVVYQTVPWNITAFFIGVVVAHQIQTKDWGWFSGWKMQLLDGVVHAVVLFLVAFFVHAALVDRVSYARSQGWSPLYSVPSRELVVAVTPAIGLVIGLAVPRGYRRETSKR
jgi:hypothetical protein